MIIYNVTVKIENEIHDEWLSWMKTVHIPEVMATGYFEDNRVAKVLIEEDDGQTYSIQYRVTDMEKLESYQRTHAPRLQQAHTKRYEGKFVAFRTLLEEI